LHEYLVGKYPGQYEQTLRTLQRRVETWRTLNGESKEVMFPLRHEPGEMELSDFTELKGVEVTIGGKPFEHPCVVASTLSRFLRGSHHRRQAV
jgi:hypothetical protein